MTGEIWLSGIIRNAEQNNPQEDGDYVKDGLLYCGKCNTPKQTIIRPGNFPLKVTCLCACKRKRQEDEEAEFKNRQFKEHIHRMRTAAFTETAMFEYTFAKDDGSNPKLTTAMRRYAERFDDMRKKGMGLLLYGPCGTGKTFAACQIGNELVDKGISVRMTNFGRLINEISGLKEGKQRYIDELNRSTLLIIDDFASERNTDYAQEIVFNVIDGRYRTGLPLIVTTNLSGTELANPDNIFRQRVYSRILQMCHPIEVNGPDKRKVQLKDGYNEIKDILGI